MKIIDDDGNDITEQTLVDMELLRADSHEMDRLQRGISQLVLHWTSIGLDTNLPSAEVFKSCANVLEKLITTRTEEIVLDNIFSPTPPGISRCISCGMEIADSEAVDEGCPNCGSPFVMKIAAATEADMGNDYRSCDIYKMEHTEMGQYEECSSCVMHSCPYNATPTDQQRKDWR